MAYYNQSYQPQASSTPQNAANLQFYPSSYGSGVSGHTTPSQASYGYGGGATSNAYPAYGTGAPAGFGAQGVSGRMGEQGGLRTGWIAAFSTEGYEGEPGLMEELGVNFGHIKMKVREKRSTQIQFIKKENYIIPTVVLIPTQLVVLMAAQHQLAPASKNCLENLLTQHL